MAEKDYYKVLGVPPEASHGEIRKAYRRLAKKHHPDRQHGSKAAEDRFKQVSEAYGVLGDPDKRKQYDRLRQAGMRGSWGDGFEGVFGGERQGPWTGQGGIRFEDLGGLGDMFSTIFGGRSGAEGGAMRRGQDVTMPISVPFETAARGGRMEVRIPREKKCPGCSGSGAAPGSAVNTCPQCRGTGRVLTGQGAFSIPRPCPSCFGRGRVIKTPCGRCRGSGTVEETSRVEVQVPAGIEAGQKIRLTGLGESGVGKAPAGDLLLEVQVQPHGRWRRKGRNIYSSAKVSMTDAALGTEVDVETMQGTITVQVPSGTQPGQKLRIAGYGLETSDGRKGDHFVEITVTVPRNLSDEQKRLLEQLRRAPAGGDR